MKRGRPITLSDQDLLEAAWTVFLERGLDATTAEVARRASISESVIFHRFKTKEALFLAVLEQQVKLAPELENLGTLAGEGDLAEHLCGMAMRLIERIRALRPLLMLAFSHPTKNLELHRRLREVHPMYVEPLIEYFDAEVRAGRLRSVDPELLANLFFGGIREYLFMEVLEGDGKSLPVEASEYVRGVVDVVLHGVASRRSLARQRSRAKKK